MSQCKSRGIHFFVKDSRAGFACLLCGFAGDLETLRMMPCVPQRHARDPDGKPDNDKVVEDPAAAAAAAAAAKVAQQLMDDERLAQELMALQIQEAQLYKQQELKERRAQHDRELQQQQQTLQALEAEEAALSALLEEQARLEVEEAAKVKGCPATLTSPDEALPPAHEVSVSVTPSPAASQPKQDEKPNVLDGLPYGPVAATLYSHVIAFPTGQLYDPRLRQHGDAGYPGA